MRFKQALSRKLAAALSAVMILSTIAPTSVPVLAAAPDDVLVDSNVEYDLQDAGSEDVLLDSAESSLAEETDTLEVAGEELLAPETASDEVLVDSAEEVLSEETGIEPVEVVEAPETVETPEEANELGWKIPITVSGGGIIKSVSWNYFGWSGHADTVSSDGGTIDMSDATSGKKTIEVLSQNGGISYDGIIITGVSFNGRAATPGEAYQDGTYNINVSANKLTGWTGDGKDIQSKADFNLQGLIGADAATPGSAVPSNYAKFVFKNGDADNKEAVYFEAEQIKFSGKLKLKVVSNNIIKSVTWYDGASKTYDTISDDSVKEFAFTNIASITDLKIPTGGVDAAFNSNAYTLSFNATGIDKDTYEVDDSKAIELKADGDVNATFSADIKSQYKTGEVKISVLSWNSTEKVSINQITYQLGNYAVKWNGTSWVKDYTSSYNKNLADGSYNGKENFVVSYNCAEDITITAPSGAQTQGNDDEKYYFLINGKVVKPGATTKVTLAGNTTQEIKVELKQVRFDIPLNMTIVSNDVIKSFQVHAYKNDQSTKIETNPDRTIDDFNNASPEFKGVSWIKILREDFVDASDPKVARGYVIKVAVEGDKTYTLDHEEEFESGKHGIWIPLNANNQLPSLTITAEPKVYVTVSANADGRKKTDKFTALRWIANNGYTTSSPATETISDPSTDAYVKFLVEKGAVVSVDRITAAKSYLFPYIKVDKVEKSYGIPTEWTLGAITDDTSFELDTKEFALKDALVVNVDKGTNTAVGQVSIDQIKINGSDPVKDEESTSTLSNNEVFTVPSSMSIRLKFTSTDEYKYSLEKYSYKYYDENSDTSYEGETSTDGDGHAIVTIAGLSANGILGELLNNDGKFVINVREYEQPQVADINLKEAPGSSMEKVVFKAHDEVVNTTSSFPGTYASVPYNSELLITGTPKTGYKLVSVNIVVEDGKTASENTVINVTNDKDLAAFTGAGYKYKMTKAATMTFTSVEDSAIVVNYKEGTDKTVAKDSKTGKYSVNHKRPVELQYQVGGSFKDFTYDVLLGSKSILDKVSTNGVVKSGTKLTFDGSNAELVGKTVTIKMMDSKGENAREVIFVVDGEKTGITFKNKEESMPLGTEKAIKASVVGVLDDTVAEAVVVGAPVGVTAKWDYKSKTLTVTTKVTASAKKYTVNIVDKAQNTIIYGTVDVDVETKTVTDSVAPVVKVTGTTNHKITLSLKANKIDTTTDHLFYKITVKVTNQDSKKNYYENKEVYVPVSETSATVDILKQTFINEYNSKNGDYSKLSPATKVAYTDSDPSAKITATIQLVQKTGDDQEVGTVKATATNKTELADTQFKLKEGGIFETKFKLTKGTKGQVWKNYGNNTGYRTKGGTTTNYASDAPSIVKDAPYIFNVVYSKNTGVQELAKAELLDKDGNPVAGGNNYLEVSDYAIKFKPNAGNAVEAGKNYQIKAYALEPNGMDVTATIKFKVEKANRILVLSDAPDRIYKLPGKAAKAQVTAYDQSSEKAKKVEYSLTTAGDGSNDADPFASTKMVKIGKSNGKITVNKNLTIDNTKFYVKATATDNKNVTTVAYSKQITVKTTYDSELYIGYKGGTYTDYNDGFAPATMKELPASGYASDVFDKTDYAIWNKDFTKIVDGYDYVTAITVYDKAKTAGVNPKYVPATIKVSGAGKLISTFVQTWATQDASNNYPTVAYIALKKEGQIKINVTANDGSERSIKNKVLTINPVTSATAFEITKSDGTSKTCLTEVALKAAGSLSVDNYTGAGDPIKLDVYGLTKDAAGGDYISFMPNSVSVKGGKVSKYRKSDIATYEILPNDATTLVTIQNKATKAKTVITIYNKAIAAKSNKSTTKVTAYSISPATKKDTKGKVYSYINFAGVAAPYKTYAQASCNKVTYTVAGASSEYVIVNILKDDNAQIQAAMNRSAVAQSGEKIGTDANLYAIKLTSGKFYVDYDTTGNGEFNIKPGSYKFTVTPAKKIDAGKYEALGKAATVNAQFAKAPKANVKPAAKVAFSGKTGTIDTSKEAKNIYALTTPKFGYTFLTGDGALKGVNNKGKINGFANNFTIDANGKLTFTGGALSGTKTSLNPKDKTDKFEFSGWVSYEYQSLDGTVAPVWLKVTIDTKGAELKK